MDEDCTMSWAKPEGHWDLVCSVKGDHMDTAFGIMAAGDCPPHEDGDRWGHWVYHPKDAALSFVEPGLGETYWIDLERCASHWGIIDWLAQLEEKSWCDATQLGYLVQALQAIVGLRYPHPPARRRKCRTCHRERERARKQRRMP